MVKYPSTPGIYLMKDIEDNVLYIGKAKNIKKRLQQYNQTKDPKLLSLLQKVHAIDTIVVTTEREALILENNLIHEYLPKYNVKLKDDKKFFCLHFSAGSWPTLVLKRGFKSGFGPYPSAKMARATLSFLQNLFPLRECSDKELRRRKRPCILYEMNRCIAPCVNFCSKKEYDDVVKKTKQFLTGDCKGIKKTLKQKIKKHNDKLEFEKSRELHATLKHLEDLFSSQYVDHTKIEQFDVFSIRLVSTSALIVELNFKNHKLTHLKQHIFHNTLSNKDQLLSQFLRQHYISHPIPLLIITSLELSDKTELETFFRDTKKRRVKLLFPKKGEKLEILDIANKNLAIIWDRMKEEGYNYDEQSLKKVLQLSKEPVHIIAVDASHCNYQESVGAVVSFIDKKKSKQKLFKTANKDDYSAIREILTRYLHSTDDSVDLIIVDGGLGQLNIACKVIEEMNLVGIDVISLAKKNHSKSLLKETIFLPGNKQVKLDRTNKELQLLQMFRDEVHRVAINFQRKRLQKRTFYSIITSVKGIGPNKKKSLLTRFKSIKELQKRLENGNIDDLNKKERLLLLEALSLNK